MLAITSTTTVTTRTKRNSEKNDFECSEKRVTSIFSLVKRSYFHLPNHGTLLTPTLHFFRCVETVLTTDVRFMLLFRKGVGQ